MIAELLARLRWIGVSTTLLVLAAILGAALAFVVILFIHGSAWIFSNTLGNANEQLWLVILLPCLAGGISGWLCAKTLHKVPPGPADVVRAKLNGLRFLSLRDGALAGSASFLCLSFGGSVGAYAPVVHLGSTIAGHACRKFGRRGIEIGLGIGCAAAIAAAFNAPLAGIIFAHEVILKNYSLRAFAPVATAALAANWVVSEWLARDNFLGTAIPTMQEIAGSEVLIFVGVGLACGLLASGIIHGCIELNRQRQKITTLVWVLPAVGGLAAGLIAVAIGSTEILGATQPLIAQIASGEDLANAQTLLLAKLLATLACIGLGMAGGLFSPALLLGALFGYSCGELLIAIFPQAELPALAVFALVGMFATAVPVIGAPMAGILIAVEFSQSYPFAISVAIAIVVASLVSVRLAGGSYYQRQLRAAGVNIYAGPEERSLSEISVHSRMKPVSPEHAQKFAITITNTDNLWQALERAQGSVNEQIGVVDKDGQLIGYLLVEELLLEQAQLNRQFRREESEL